MSTLDQFNGSRILSVNHKSSQRRPALHSFQQHSLVERSSNTHAAILRVNAPPFKPDLRATQHTHMRDTNRSFVNSSNK
jgi:hypothetical protein